MNLRDYQVEILNEVRATPGPALVVAPTGAGKTVMQSGICKMVDGQQLIVAHRQELVSQLALAMAHAGLWHQVIAPKNVIEHAVNRQIEKCGMSWCIQGAPILIAGVDTLLRREVDLANIRLWQVDEGHHVVPGNKWSSIIEQMPGVYGLGWTATPRRTDRKALSGVYRNLILGPTTRELCNRGFLTPIRVFAPSPVIARELVPISESTGEVVRDAASKLLKQTRVVGNVVEHYLRLAPGVPGLIFAMDVDLAAQHASAFKAAGIAAEVITYKTPQRVRDHCLDALVSGTLQIIVNVDMFGEGTDIPEVGYIGCARLTESLSLWRQMCGRVMRLAPGKSHGIICDHVGNTLRHGLPDCDVAWSLEGQRKNKLDSSPIPLRTCERCFFAFEGFHKVCPYCGWKPDEGIKQAKTPEQVEGNLEEYSDELMQQLLGAANKAIHLPYKKPKNLKERVMFKAMLRRRNAQIALREAINTWCSPGRTNPDGFREFFHTFGIDVLSAQSLGGPDAEKLCAEIRKRC